jgi:hypothetical protein
MGQPLTRIKNKMTLPHKISSQQIIENHKELGQLEGEVELAKQIADSQEKQVQTLIKLQEINKDFSTKMMAADNKLRQIEASHARRIGQYQLGAAITQASLNGYQEAYQMSGEIFR